MPSRYIDGTWDGPATRVLLREAIAKEVRHNEAFKECYYVYRDGKFYSSVDKNGLVDEILADIDTEQPPPNTNEEERTVTSTMKKAKIRAAKKAEIQAVTGDVLAVSPDKDAVPEGSIEYDTAVEDFVDLLTVVIDGFQLFPSNADAATRESIVRDAVACVLADM